MYHKTLQEMSDLCDILGGLSISFAGYGNYDETRVTCIQDSDGKCYANYILHSLTDGFIYGGQSGCIFGDDVSEVLGETICKALGFNNISEVWETVFEINEMRDLNNPSISELTYGSEAWNAYDRGHEVR